jgi:DNA repair ATPase RecN
MIKRFNTFNTINEDVSNITFKNEFIVKSIENIEKELKYATDEMNNINSNYTDDEKLKNNQIDDIIQYYENNIENLQKTLDNLNKIKDLVKNYQKNGEQYLF